MAEYTHNRACGCARCRARGLMGPAVLITLGVLFMLQEFSRYDFNETWPVLLIVIGLIKILSTSGSTEGHRDQSYGAPPPPAPSVGPESGSPPQQVEHV